MKAMFAGPTALLAAVVVSGCDAPESAESYAPPPATPIGITIENVHRPLARRGPQVERALVIDRHYATEDGRTLYTFKDDTEAGHSVCTGPCAAAWPPAAAAADAQPVAGWSIIVRPDGGRQWAHNGAPLYTYAKDEQPGDTKGDGIGDKWQRAVYKPQATIAVPKELAIAPRIAMADGPALTDSRGMTLYIYEGDTKPGQSACTGDCAVAWPPVKAAQLAKPSGEWSLIERADGSRQWAFRDKPLYTYTGDTSVGESNGVARKGWHAALIEDVYRPAEVSVGMAGRDWSVFTTTRGMTLYARDIYRYNLGHIKNPAEPSAAEDGRAIGTAGCSGECTRTWLPLQAPDAARSTGYWSVVARDDGSKQWAYKGFPLYSYAGDQAPGEVTGHDIFDVAADFVSPPFWRVALP